MGNENFSDEISGNDSSNGKGKEKEKGIVYQIRKRLGGKEDRFRRRAEHRLDKACFEIFGSRIESINFEDETILSIPHPLSCKPLELKVYPIVTLDSRQAWGVLGPYLQDERMHKTVVPRTNDVTADLAARIHLYRGLSINGLANLVAKTGNPITGGVNEIAERLGIPQSYRDLITY